MTGKMLLAAALLLTTIACGGGSGGNTPTSPTNPTTPPTGGGGTQATTITIAQGGGVSPTVLTVSPGTQVTFINNDSRNHDVKDDPHPTHGDCPAIAQVSYLTSGQQRQTGNLNVVRTCGWHDHDNPSIRGSIVVR